MKFLIKILKNTAKSFTFVFGGAFAIVIGIFIFTAAVMIYIDPLKIYHINQEFSKKTLHKYARSSCRNYK